MKYILTFLMLFGIAYAQEPTYTPMKGNYKFKGIRVDSLFLIPSFNDTAAANATKLDSIAGAMIRTGNDFWMRNASTTAWLQNVNVGDGASPGSVYNLQDVTDKGDTTTNSIVFYDYANNGFDGAAVIGVNGVSGGPVSIGSFLYLSADGCSPSNQKISLYNEKSDGNNYLKMEGCSGSIFQITNGSATALNTQNGPLYISSSLRTIIENFSGSTVYNANLDGSSGFVLTDNTYASIYRFTLTDASSVNVELPSAATYQNVVFHISRETSGQDGTISIISSSDIEDETGTYDTSFDLNDGEKCTWASDGTDWILINYSN